MNACVKKQKPKFHIILFPDKQPVRLNMTFPLTNAVTAKFMRPIGGREPAVLLKKDNGLTNEIYIQAPFLTSLQIILKAISIVNGIHQPRIWVNISSTLSAW